MSAVLAYSVITSSLFIDLPVFPSLLHLLLLDYLLFDLLLIIDLPKL